VKQIFHLYTRRRLGCRAVATHLNEHDLLRRSAPAKASAQSRLRPWSHKTVADVLTNRVYLGEVHFREVIAVDAHKAVIDPATFDLAQQILAERGETPAKKANASSEYHLTGKITCPRYARRYIGTNAYGRSRTYRYYTCWTRNRYGVDHCDAPRIDADASTPRSSKPSRTSTPTGSTRHSTRSSRPEPRTTGRGSATSAS
jgi:site-specific DNA recombinase